MYKCDPNEWWSVSNTMGEHTCLLKDYDYFLTLSKMSKTCYDEDEDEVCHHPWHFYLSKGITWHVFASSLAGCQKGSLWCLISNLLLFFVLVLTKLQDVLEAGADEGQFIFLTNDLALKAVRLEEEKVSLLLVFFLSIMHIDRKWWPCNRSFVPGDFESWNCQDRELDLNIWPWQNTAGQLFYTMCSWSGVINVSGPNSQILLLLWINAQGTINGSGSRKQLVLCWGAPL